MTNPNATNYRQFGDVPLAVITALLTAAKSPMVPTLSATYAAITGNTALFFAQAWMENQWETTGIVIKPEDHNPVSLRPWTDDPTATVTGDLIDSVTRAKVGTIKVPPGAIGAILEPDKSMMLRFSSDAAGAREWQRRIITDLGYKAGIYTKAVTLEQMVDIYCPPGDIHPVTGNDANATYAPTVRAKLAEFAAAEAKLAPVTSTGGTTVVTPVPNPTPTPAKLLKLFTDADTSKLLVTRDKNNVYFNLPDTEITATEDTFAYAYGDKSAPKAPVKKGETRTAAWAWTQANGTVWLYDTIGDRLLGAHWSGTLPVLPDTNPGSVITDGGSGATTEITDYSQVTAANYKTVKDPSILLPPLVWKGTTNFFANRSGKKPIAMCYHVTDDLVTDNTISWFLNPSSQASSHFVIDTDGTVYQFVSSTDGAWTNGDFELEGQLGYRTDIPALVNAITAGPNLNDYTITIEHVGKPGNVFPKAQIDASIRLARYFAHPAVYGITTDRSHQWRHSDINKLTREYCPSPSFPLDQIITALGGDPAKIA